jgi:hypothetical protein
VSDDHESPAGAPGIAVAAVGVCCGLPLLLAAGVAVGAVLGSAVVAAAGSAVAAWGWRRDRWGAGTCDAAGRGEPADTVTSDALGGPPPPPTAGGTTCPRAGNPWTSWNVAAAVRGFGREHEHDD